MPKAIKTIGIIGSDSSHVYAFTKLINESKGFRVKEILSDTESTKRISVDRQATVQTQIETLPNVKMVRELSEADAYLILNVDADLHHHHLKAVRSFHKPVFVDKPLAYSLDEVEYLLDHYDFMSSSALRYCDFVLAAQTALSESSEVLIEGAFASIDEIPSFSWYGIHLIEILATLFPKLNRIDDIKLTEDAIILSGIQGKHHYRVIAYLQKEQDFKITLGNHKGETEAFMHSQEKPIYTGIVGALLAYCETGINPISKQSMFQVMQLLEQVNCVLDK